MFIKILLITFLILSHNIYAKRIFILETTDSDFIQSMTKSLISSLYDKKIISKKDIVIVKNAKGSKKEAEKFLRLELKNNPDLVISNATLAAQVAQDVLNDKIPHVFFIVMDPISANLVKAIDRPSNKNITGVVFSLAPGRKTEVLNEILSKYDSEKKMKIGIIYSTYPSAMSDVAHISYGLSSQSKYEFVFKKLEYTPGLVNDYKTLEKAVTELAPKVDFWWEARDVLSLNKKYRGILKRYRPILFGNQKSSVEDGALFHIGLSNSAIIELTSNKIQKILSGTNAGDIPVERPKKTELSINVKTAEKLKIPIKSGLIKLAAENLVFTE